MEKIYRKVGRRYVSCGYNNIPDISDGIWLVQTQEHSKSRNSLLWRVGDLKRPVDVVTHAALMSMEEELATYLVKLGKENSQEYLEAKEILDGYLYGVVGYSNISASDLCSLFLRRIAIGLESGEKTDWHKLMFKFRETRDLQSLDTQLLYDVFDWIKANGYELKQNK